MDRMLKPYLKKVFAVASQGDAREESYYSVLAEMLNEYAKSTNKKEIHITTLPKKTEAGNPDFRIWDGKLHIIGYFEAKAPAIENLDFVEVSEQLKRYRHTFPNLILTNFFEFRLYRNGSLIDRVQIARPFVGGYAPETFLEIKNEKDFLGLLEKFFSFSLPKVKDAKNLALELAKRTRFLKDEVIAEELKEKGKGFIIGFYEAFQKYLISGLSKRDFADLYSQTITYGLFAARTRSENTFNRKLAYDKIPHTIGILKDVFKFISLGDLPPQMECIIDDISEVLAVTDVKKILHQYFHEAKGRDPIVHFYETFLAEYDPKTREKRGVYYTPEPVVSYIVRSLHQILKEHFNRPEGLASESVTVLDPAAGTLTFLAEATKVAVEEFTAKYGEGGKDNFIKEHILKNFYAFELMMAPYAIGHLKMSFLLEELGYKLQKNDRFKLYLTNTLEMEDLAQTDLPGMSSLSEESHLAGKVKKEVPILVILGNPPYAGHSANASEKYITIKTNNGKEKRKKVKTWIGNLIENYKFVDSKPLGERNPKWLQDDYVKFIRFAQWKIDQTGEGVLGFITNHSYLDNPTFRGMRQSLMKSFDEIYLLNLHGNSLKKEKCPDGSKDENVFDIRQGVSIALFIKTSTQTGILPSPRRRRTEGEVKNVFHADLWGLRERKNDWLLKNDVKTTKWQKLSPKSEFYLFIPRDEKLLGTYNKYPKITEIFPVSSVGIVTARDNFVIDFDKQALMRRIRMICNRNLPDEIIKQTFRLNDKPNWKLSNARENIQKDEKWKEKTTKILYRPFDVRWIFYHDEMIERSRREVMRHMIQKNLGLITIRRSRSSESWKYAFVTDKIIAGATSITSLDINYLFPLYLYKNSKPKEKKKYITPMMVFDSQEDYKTKEPNLSPGLIKQISAHYKKQPSPEEIFYYIYGMLYSNIYRSKYAEFLKIDFPRIPFTKKYELFIKMARYGEKLAQLHLLKSDELDTPIAKFHIKGDNRVKKLRYDENENRVYINQIHPCPPRLGRRASSRSNRDYGERAQYFDGISNEVWEYQIGGYKVCHKWLKDKKGRILSLDDIKHYCKIVTSLQKTIEIQKTIDKIYPKIEKNIIEV